MSSRNLLIAVVALLLLGGGAYYLMSNQSALPTPSTPETINNIETEGVPESATESSDQTADSEVKEFAIESNGINYNLKEIRVNEGDTVRVTYKNNLGSHDWNLDEFNAKTLMLNAGEEETVEFVADKAGTYEFYCSVPGHRQQGMKGAFIVE